MNAAIKKRFEMLEVQRKDLLGKVRDTAHAHLVYKPNNKWSILEILAHLVSAERVSLLYVRKKIQGVNDATDSGVWEEVKVVLLQLSQRLPGLKYKAPGVIVENTSAFGSIAELETAWEELRSDWRKFLETIPDHHAKRKIFRHAIAGRLNVAQGLLFLREHIIHHEPQIKKILLEPRPHV